MPRHVSFSLPEATTVRLVGMIERLTSEEGSFRLVVPNFDGVILFSKKEPRVNQR